MQYWYSEIFYPKNCSDFYIKHFLVNFLYKCLVLKSGKATMAHRPIKSIGSLLWSSGQNNMQNNEDVVKQGYLKKRKNMKARYFVLRRETSKDHPARLECYDKKEKFVDGCQPKKKYVLKECFNISRKTDEHNFVIALYIQKDCIALVMESEADLQEWLQSLQFHKNSVGGENKSNVIEYEHVWEVEVLPRSKAKVENLTGHHWLYLTNKCLALVRRDVSKITREFQLDTIIKCESIDQFFIFETGLNSIIGCGELHMQTEDSFIAQNIKNSVRSAMNIFKRTASMSELLKRSPSDTQPDSISQSVRMRADSVPNNPRGYSYSRLTSDHLHQHIVNNLDGKLGGVHPEEEDRQSSTPDAEIKDLDDDYSSYIPMDIDRRREKVPPIINSPLGIFGDFLDSADDDEYMPMGMDDRQPPNSLGVSPRLIRANNSPLVSPVSPSGVSSNWGRCGPNSPHTPTIGSHSRNHSLLDDAYVPMGIPKGQISPQSQLEEYKPYVDMGPAPAGNPAGAEKQRSVSTPTPIPVSPCDDSYYEMIRNHSTSSSCTSGTPSDQQIQDIIGDERGGGTPHSGMWGSLTPNLSGGEDPDSLGGPRPIRTNSVGSKPDQYKRKNRLDTALPPGEPSRVRAFSVGSRVSLKFGIGRPGTATSNQGTEPPSGGLGDLFPSIKESGKRAKSKSSSAPMLGSSPISHSWSGTTGTYFRGFSQSRNTNRDANFMELDFTKNKSYDFIPGDEKERRTSKERLWHTFTVCGRNRSNSKSSGGSSNSKLGVGEKKGAFEGEGESARLDINPSEGDKSEYFKLDFTPSSRTSSMSEHHTGYLPMHPPSFISSSLTSTGDILVTRGPRTTSLNESYLEMTTNDGYVDMSQGGGINFTSSSSSNNSLNGSSSTTTAAIGIAINRKTSKSECSHELPSPMEDFVMDWVPASESEGSRSKKKMSKRRSLRDSGKRKKSAEGGVGGESPEFPNKVKANGPLATLTNLITRKASNAANTNAGQKVPLSPKGSPLPPKGCKESQSPFSSLKRIKGKDNESYLEERETVSLSGDVGTLPEEVLSSSIPSSLSPQGSLRKRTMDGVDRNMIRGDEKMMMCPLNRKETLATEITRRSAYMNLDDGLQGSSGGSLPTLNALHKPVLKSSIASDPRRNYVNMQPGTSSPQLSPPAGDVCHKISPLAKVQPLQDVAKPTVSSSEGNYVMMSQEKESRAPSQPTEVAKRPEIPVQLLSTHSQPDPSPAGPSLSLEKLSLKEDKLSKQGSEGSNAPFERCRSHSGPGATGASDKGVRKQLDEGRPASAHSSPASYSPPTSPLLGSVSSFSSLSESGMSSASSTCTVINVGVRNPSLINPVSVAKASAIAGSDTGNTAASNLKEVLPVQNENLNYVSLDLGSSKSSSTSCSPRLAHKTRGQTPPSGDDTSSSYVEIDFKKSEGLRNTSIARDSSRPH